MVPKDGPLKDQPLPDSLVAYNMYKVQGLLLVSDRDPQPGLAQRRAQP